MKILVIEDNPEKSRAISSVVKSLNLIDENNIVFVQDRISAKRKLTDTSFSLMLLDIQIPNRFDQVADKDGGVRLINEILSSNKYIIPTHIIGITAYDDIYDEVFPTFSNRLIAIIKYERESIVWEEQLKNKIKSIASSANTFNTTVGYLNSLAIICALESPELEAVKNISNDWHIIEIANDSTNYYRGTFSDGKNSITFIAAAAPQMGMTAAAVLTTKIISHFRPKYLCITGISAGVKGETNYGDILVADPSWDYGNGKYTREGKKTIFKPDPLPIRLDPFLKSIIQKSSTNSIELEMIKSSYHGEKPDTSLKVHIGPVASGASVISDPSITIDIQNHQRKLVGIEMETYGVLYASLNYTNPSPTAFSLKSVCDFANEEKNNKYQRYAAHTSASYLKMISLQNFIVK
ncbi:MAG: hypothetical protein VR65_09275 [Desulfobulbaceae bacterium BRH_c16a]|nr:MAG: hypothetical protein VR65_09275 [Desulfobulbaceae bacterium BRH_c16a]